MIVTKNTNLNKMVQSNLYCSILEIKEKFKNLVVITTKKRILTYLLELKLWSDRCLNTAKRYAIFKSNFYTARFNI